MNFAYLLGSLKSLNEVIHVKEIESGFRATVTPVPLQVLDQVSYTHKDQ